jgi:hypothetical protein
MHATVTVLAGCCLASVHVVPSTRSQHSIQASAVASSCSAHSPWLQCNPQGSPVLHEDAPHVLPALSNASSGCCVLLNPAAGHQDQQPRPGGVSACAALLYCVITLWRLWRRQDMHPVCREGDLPRCVDSSMGRRGSQGQVRA